MRKSDKVFYKELDKDDGLLTSILDLYFFPKRMQHYGVPRASHHSLRAGFLDMVLMVYVTAVPTPTQRPTRGGEWIY